MNLKPYLAKQEELEQYRTNLHRLDLRIASEGGYIHAPVNVQNQYDQTKAHIETLEAEIEAIEIRMMDEIPVIRDAIKKRESKIEYLSSDNKEMQATLEWRKFRIEKLTHKQDDTITRISNSDIISGSLQLIESMCSEIGFLYKRSRTEDNKRIEELIESLISEIQSLQRRSSKL